MTSPTDIPAAAKARTIAHMNKDHQTDLAHILRHFNGISAAAAADAEMVDIDLASITVRAGGQTHVVQLAPPMAAWDDRRQRLIEMTMAAREALGVVSGDGDGQHGPLPPSKAPGYLRPRGTDWVSFCGVSLYFACLAVVRVGGGNNGAAAALEAVMGPWAWARCEWLVDVILVPVLAIHIAEVWWMERSRLSRYGVARGSAAWGLWLASVFLEGFPAFRRFDAKRRG